MKLKVPFYRQKTSLDCGPIGLKMVLSYFGGRERIRNIRKKTGIRRGKGISTIQIATASALLGYKTEFYSKQLSFNEEHKKLDFYKKHADLNLLEQSALLIRKAKKAGVILEERTFSLEKILRFVTKDSLPIVLLDWNLIKEKREKGYQGHFVPIVGYDRQNVYVHSDGKPVQKFMKIRKVIFDKARKAKGTDEDIVVVYRK